VQPSLQVLLVEDDWSVRGAVRDYLAKHEMVVSEADCLETALSAADTLSPDVAVVDIVLPERAGERPNFDRHVGIQVARQLRERFPKLGVVFLSAYADRGPEVVQLFMDGHQRIVYLLKDPSHKNCWMPFTKLPEGCRRSRSRPVCRRHARPRLIWPWRRWLRMKECV